MPRSAINAGLGDAVAPAEELAPRILAFLRHLPMLARAQPAPTPIDDGRNGIDKVVTLLRERTGHDFSRYRKSARVRRIERRMGLRQLPKLADYVRLLRQSKVEAGCASRSARSAVWSMSMTTS